jgi:hypothetical protein
MWEFVVVIRKYVVFYLVPVLVMREWMRSCSEKQGHSGAPESRYI